MHDLASVHGRFQPPHLDHLEYMLAALARTKHCIVGITQPNVGQLTDCPEDPHRSEERSNPLSYEERCVAITNMLVAEGVQTERFSFVRFPIEDPLVLTQYIDVSVLCFTTIRDEWNVVKVDRLKSLGYDVHVLWDRRGQAGIQGTEIRRKIAEQDNSWRVAVHPAVIAYMERYGILDRISKSARGKIP